MTNIGTLVLSGTNTYPGATNVTSGRLLVHGDQSAATGLVSVGSGATWGATMFGGIAGRYGGSETPLGRQTYPMR